MKRLIVILSVAAVPLTLLAQVDTAWMRTYPVHESAWTNAQPVAVDDSGNVYTAGWTTVSGDGRDYFVAKYNSVGDTLWSRTYNGSGSYTDAVSAMAVDGQGNVYVTGSATSSANHNPVCATVKWDRDGVRQWAIESRHAQDFQSGGLAIQVDAGGFVYVAGNVMDSLYNTHGLLLKFDPGGTQVWERRYASHTFDAFNTLAMDGSALYAGGWCRIQQIRAVDAALVVRYSTDGDTAWSRVVTTAAKDNSKPVAGAVDHDHNPVFAATIRDSITTNARYLTIKYDPGGAEQWRQIYGGPVNVAEPSGLAIDDSNNIFLTGYSRSVTTGDDYTTIKYNPNGESLWTRRYNTTDSCQYPDDKAAGIAINRLGRIYVTGYTADTGITADVTTIRYDQSGHELWVWTGLPGQATGGTAVATNDAGMVVSAANVYPLAATLRYEEYRLDHDVGCLQIIAPLGTIDSGMVVAPVCSVYNYGTFNESYRVRLRIGNSYNETAFVVGHVPSTARGVIFPSWTATQRGRNAVICATELADDSNRTNDARTDSVTVRTAAIEESNDVLSPFALAIRPNPVTFGAAIDYSLPARAEVRLAAFDISGRLVRIMVQGSYPPGQTAFAWNRTDAAGRLVASGVYFIRLEAGGREITRRLTIQ